MEDSEASWILPPRWDDADARIAADGRFHLGLFLVPAGLLLATFGAEHIAYVHFWLAIVYTFMFSLGSMLAVHHIAPMELFKDLIMPLSLLLFALLVFPATKALPIGRLYIRARRLLAIAVPACMAAWMADDIARLIDHYVTDGPGLLRSLSVPITTVDTRLIFSVDMVDTTVMIAWLAVPALLLLLATTATCWMVPALLLSDGVLRSIIQVPALVGTHIVHVSLLSTTCGAAVGVLLGRRYFEKSQQALVEAYFRNAIATAVLGVISTAYGLQFFKLDAQSRLVFSYTRTPTSFLICCVTLLCICFQLRLYLRTHFRVWVHTHPSWLTCCCRSRPDRYPTASSRTAGSQFGDDFYMSRRAVDDDNLGGFSGEGINPRTGASTRDANNDTVSDRAWKQFVQNETSLLPEASRPVQRAPMEASWTRWGGVGSNQTVLDHAESAETHSVRAADRGSSSAHCGTADQELNWPAAVVSPVRA